MAVRSRLDLESVLAQLEEEFRTAEGEYEVSRDQDALAKHSDDNEEGITDLSSLRTSEQVDVMIVAREGEAEGLEVTASARNGVEGLCLSSTSQSNGEVTQPAQEEDAPHLCDSSTVSVEHSFEDKEEDDKIVKFITETCGCTLGPNKSPCSGQFSQITITLTRSNCLQLVQRDLDLVVMAPSKPSSYRGDMATSRPSTSFYLHGLQICRKTFCFVHVIGREHFENLCKAVDRNGVVQRLHEIRNYRGTTRLRILTFFAFESLSQMLASHMGHLCQVDCQMQRTRLCFYLLTCLKAKSVEITELLVQ